jgi:hypothetical protein
MNVIHILSDGSRVEDITGHVVKVADAEALYNMIREINCKTNEIHTLSDFKIGAAN